MVLVVSDSSPINVLTRIGCIDILGKLFQLVTIPPAVERELSHPNTPQVVRDWLASHPAWLEVRRPTFVDPSLSRDPGEREAICLAREIEADAILLDDLHARRIAERLGLNVTGTVGVLAMASEAGLLSLSEVMGALGRTDFRISEELLASVLQKDARRPGRKT